MTLQKKLKKAIRARSEKTGESYTSARRQVLLARDRKEAPLVPVEPEPLAPAPTPAPPSRTQTRGEVSDEAARNKTGHGLDHWFAVLDAFGAAGKGHTAAAAHLNKDHGIPGWHAQGITVAYERARGLREVNQSCAGTFQVSVSKTVPASVAEVIQAFQDAGRRAEWLRGADPGLVQALDAAFTADKPREVKTKGADYAWFRFPWDGPTVEIRMTGKPKGTSVAADNAGLAAPELVEQRRAQWKVALEGLRKHFGA
jgi:uncharacterized protein DUF4287